MPQTSSRFFDDLSRLMTDAAGLADGARREAQTFAKSQLERVHQSFDGRMDYSVVATSTVQDLLGRPALTLREWAPRHREALLAAASK